jgi:hypothetical protein
MSSVPSKSQELLTRASVAEIVPQMVGAPRHAI